MRANLRQYNITEIHLYTTLDLNQEVVAEIWRASPPDEDGDSVFLDPYRVNGVPHRAWIWVMKRDENARKFGIELNWEVGKTGRVSKTAPRSGSVIDILSSIGEETDIYCSVQFRFGKRQKAKTIIPLPLKLLDSPSVPFDEIAGFHLVKRSGQRVDYDVLLDLAHEGFLRAGVFFGHSGRIQENLLDDIIQRAMSISNNLVLKGES